MDNQPQPNKQKQIQIQVTETAKNPIYANAMQVRHTGDEFVLDFLKLFPPTATLNARIITSPGHLKRIIAALEDNLKRYEATHGTVKISDAPHSEIGFSQEEEKEAGKLR